MIIRFLGHRVLQVRKMSFKRPPPDYIFKREIVPSDLDGSKLKSIFDCENDKWTNSGKKLYYPKYGTSIYDDKIIYNMDEKFMDQNSRED